MGLIWQRQQTNEQLPMAGPPPGPGLLPVRPDEGARAPIAQNDPLKAEQRPLERVLQVQQSPFQTWLRQMVPVYWKPSFQHAHRIHNPVEHFSGGNAQYPRGPRYNASQALLRRPTVRAFAPVQLQLTPGGLANSTGNIPEKSINSQLAELYHGWESPLPSNYSALSK
jgi:hypothetical protein